MSADADILIGEYKRRKVAFSGFLSNVVTFFSAQNDALMDSSGKPVVHSVKSREKDLGHLREKIIRKQKNGALISTSNLFSSITDFCGVRVLHLRLRDFVFIHKAIMDHVDGQHWFLFERPKAYTWDPESKAFFEKSGVSTEIKESFYTSVHYVVKPNPESAVTCEIQVRTLFEEIWGEIDHDLNYPVETTNLACREQLKVLAKIVGAGSRLIDSIYNSISAPHEPGLVQRALPTPADLHTPSSEAPLQDEHLEPAPPVPAPPPDPPPEAA